MPIIDGIEVPGELGARVPMQIDVDRWQDVQDNPAFKPFEGIFAAPREWAVPPAPPAPFKPIPDPAHYYDYEFEGVMVKVPDWATHICQDVRGQIMCFGTSPLNIGHTYVRRNVADQYKILAKPEDYPMVVERL